MTSNELTTYLNQVRTALGDHPEAEDIIQELHAHIWDYANNLSRKSGCSVDDAFSMAIQSMEDPVSLASSFKREISTATSWREPKSPIPEKKLSDRDFLVIGIIGFLTATIMLTIISWVGDFTGTDVTLANFIIQLIQFNLLIFLILGIFYYRNEQEFQDQMKRLKLRFEKLQNFDENSDEGKKTMKAAEIHIEGFFEVIFGAGWLVFMLYATFVVESVVFTAYWYSIGLFVVVFLSIVEILRGMIKMFVGQIRISRLVASGTEICALIGSIIMIIFYPLDLVTWFDSFSNPTAVMFVDWIYRTTSRPDFALRILFGISGVFSFMSALYNLAKFGMWTPAQQHSLTIKKQEGI